MEWKYNNKKEVKTKEREGKNMYENLMKKEEKAITLNSLSRHNYSTINISRNKYRNDDRRKRNNNTRNKSKRGN